MYTDLGTPCVASAAGALRRCYIRRQNRLRRNNPPGVENSNGRTPRDNIPLALTRFGWAEDKALDQVLWVLDTNVWQFAKIVGVDLDLQLHGLKVWDGEGRTTDSSSTRSHLPLLESFDSDNRTATRSGWRSKILRLSSSWTRREPEVSWYFGDVGDWEIVKPVTRCLLERPGDRAGINRGSSVDGG